VVAESLDLIGTGRSFFIEPICSDHLVPAQDGPFVEDLAHPSPIPAPPMAVFHLEASRRDQT